MLERDFTRQQGDAPERGGVVLCLSGRTVEPLHTPSVTAYRVEPGQTFDPQGFNPGQHLILRTLDLPPDTPWLPHGPMQHEGNPTLDNSTEVLLFGGILMGLAASIPPRR